jgi:hypothetical protein
MPTMPAHVTFASMASMSVDELLDAEFAMHVRFIQLDAVEKRLKGRQYNLMKGSAELVDVWDQWGRLTRAARARSLEPRKLSPSDSPSTSDGR